MSPRDESDRDPAEEDVPVDRDPDSIERRLAALRERLRRIRADYRGDGAGFDLERELVLSEEELGHLHRSVSEWFRAGRSPK